MKGGRGKGNGRQARASGSWRRQMCGSWFELETLDMQSAVSVAIISCKNFWVLLSSGGATQPNFNRHLKKMPHDRGPLLQYSLSACLHGHVCKSLLSINQHTPRLHFDTEHQIRVASQQGLGAPPRTSQQLTADLTPPSVLPSESR